jgi:16S rRNA (guanine(966)-N(2))-methyltransferase RsmD
MRIIAGKARGLKLSVPKGLAVRPTADRVKEALFAILGERVAGAKVLDLFAGSGGLGIEAFSRGAAQAAFADNSALSLTYLRRNIEKAEAGAQVKIYRGDALKTIERLHRRGEVFDLIFGDPPYRQGWVARTLAQIKIYNILARNAIIIMEYSKHEEFLPPAGLTLLRNEKYGETMVAFVGHAAQGEIVS